MNENETYTNQKTVRIKERTYNRLSDLGTVKETFNNVIERLLSLGDNVSFTLRMDPEKTPLIENRMNNVIFYRDSTALCLVRTGWGMVWLYIPTETEDTKFPGWKDEWNILEESGMKREIEVIKRLYEDM